jgi:hypothetical protein
MKSDYQGYNYQMYREFRNRKVGRGFVMYAGYVGLILAILGEAPIWMGVIGLFVGIVSTALYFDYRREANYYRQIAHGEGSTSSQF